MASGLELVRSPTSMRERLILALDLDDVEEVKKLVSLLAREVGMFKVGKQFFLHSGPQGVRLIQEMGGEVFLDLKFHDIPNTVAGAVAAAAKTGANMINMHASGGLEMMRAASEAANTQASELEMPRPLLLGVTAGHDPMDSTSALEPVDDYLEGLSGDVRKLRVGVPRDLPTEGLDPDVESAYRAGIATLEGLGVEPVEIELPTAPHAVACYYLISTAEASSNLARYDGVRYGLRAGGQTDLREMYRRTRNQGFGAEVKRRIILGTYVLSTGYYEAYYLKAQKVRTLISRDFHRAFENVDAIAMPTTPTPAFRLGEKIEDPLQMYLTDIFTITASLVGLPAISLPAGFSRDGLPIGLQLLGNHFAESTVLRLAHAFEQATDFAQKRPPLD